MTVPASSEFESMEPMVPKSTIVQVVGKDVQIVPIKLKNVPAVLKSIKPFSNLFVNGAPKMGPLEVMSLVEDHYEDVVEFLIATSGQPLEKVQDMDLDEVVILFQAVVEVNLDFFIKRVFPSASLAMARLVGSQSSLPSTGQSPSNT